jgi:hypothetical protein
MNWRPNIFLLAIWFAAGAMGCESVALMPRPDIDRQGNPIDRGDNRDRAPTRDVVGTVREIDQAAREIHLRTSDGGSVILKYDPRTVVRHRDRELRVEDLRAGDLILAEVARNARGDQYAETIRMNDRPS